MPDTSRPRTTRQSRRMRSGHRAVVVTTIASVAVIGCATPAGAASRHEEPFAHRAQNGPIAVSAVTVVDGAYDKFQIATVGARGAAPYHFLTHLDIAAEDALNPDFTPDGTRIYFGLPPPPAMGSSPYPPAAAPSRRSTPVAPTIRPAARSTQPSHQTVVSSWPSGSKGPSTTPAAAPRSSESSG